MLSVPLSRIPLPKRDLKNQIEMPNFYGEFPPDTVELSRRAGPSLTLAPGRLSLNVVTLLLVQKSRSLDPVA